MKSRIVTWGIVPALIVVFAYGVVSTIMAPTDAVASPPRLTSQEHAWAVQATNYAQRVDAAVQVVQRGNAPLRDNARAELGAIVLDQHTTGLAPGRMALLDQQLRAALGACQQVAVAAITPALIRACNAIPRSEIADALAAPYTP